MGCRLGWDQQCVALPGVEASVKEMEEKAYTVCYLCVDMQLVTIFGIADATRQEAHEAVKALQGLGVEPVMITGDQKRAAEAVARQMGITTIQAECLPQDKVDAVQSFKRKGLVGMVGDGINDAAALAVSDVGIAMGAAGTQVAMENAHVTLLDSDLRKLVGAIRLGRHAITKIRQNVGFAIFSKIVMVIITMVGYASLWGAIVADLGAMLVVTLNASLVLNRRKRAPNHHQDKGCCGNIVQAIKDDWNGNSSEGHGHAHAHGGGGCCGNEEGGHSHGHAH